MDTSSVEELAPLVSRPGIPSTVPDTRRSYEKRLAVYLILASTLLERVAFYSLAANLVLHLKSPELLNEKSTNWIVIFIFSGTTYISTLIFAVISDAKLGRASTIIVGFFLYVTGYIWVILITNTTIIDCECDRSNETSTIYTNIMIKESCVGWILGTLVIIAVGAGAVQSNMAVFGAEQIQESRIAARYYDKYMVAINIGGSIATSVIPYIPTGGKPCYTPFLIAASLLCVAAVLFIIGCRYYIHVKPYDTVITKCIPVVISAFQSWYKYQKNTHSTDKEDTISSPASLANASHSLTDEENSIRIDERPSTFLDFAKAANNGKFNDRIVDDVKSLRGAFVVFTLLIPYWLVYNQMNSTFYVQGHHMKMPQGVTNIVTLVSLGDPVAIVIGILILNICVYKYLDARNRSLTIITKFIIGMCFAFLTMCIAGTVEIFRQQNCHGQNESELSVFVQLPQNIFMGLSELFALVASYEFAYFAAPRSAQSLFMSLRFVSIGISSFIGSAYITVFSTYSVKMDFSCPPENQLYWSFYAYFYILAGLQLVFIIIFIVCQKKYRIVKLNPQQTERNQFLQHSSMSSTIKQ